jgi:hypothetical protein
MRRLEFHLMGQKLLTGQALSHSAAICSIKLIATSTPRPQMALLQIYLPLLCLSTLLFRKLLRRRAVAVQVCDRVAGTLMPLHDNPDSERLLDWMNKSPRYSLNDQKPSGWTPFQGCAYCNGLCSVLESADAVRQLLNGQRVPVFQGRYEELLWLAMRGFKFAKYLMSYLNDFKMKDYRLHEPLDLGFWRIDQRDPSRVRLVSLVQGTEDGDVLPLYFAIATAPSKLILCYSIKC